MTVGGSRGRYSLAIRGGEAVLGERTWVMGVLNVTPDSFYDGGAFGDADAAVARGMALFEAGADIVGVRRVEASEGREGGEPVVRGLRDRGAGFLSVDTTRAEVARAALDAGADLVNDVSGFAFDPGMAALVAERRVPAVV